MSGGFVSRRKLIGATLLVSLSVNAFFIGAAATDVFRSTVGHDHHQPGGNLFRFDLRWLDGHLPDDAMAKIESDVARGVPGADKRFERVHALRDELAGLVAAPSPDRVAIDAKLAEIRTELNGIMSDSQSATVASMLALPPETRANLTEEPDQPDPADPQG